jgi:putative DNA primase/helicase
MTTPPEKFLAIATFDNKNDTTPKTASLPWPQLVEMLTTHVEREEKDGPLFSPAVYRDGTSRANENVKAITLAVADFDHSEAWGEIAARLVDYEYIVYSTHTHLEESPRYRVVIRLARPISAIEWPEVKARLYCHVYRTADKAASDPSRMFYLPSCKPCAPRFADYHKGACLDPDELPGVPALSVQARPATHIDITDLELIEKAKCAKNGQKFYNLWNGDTSAYGGDDSAADLALANLLIFWTSGDAQRTDRLFRQSGLMRDKWDERHGKTTYGERTLGKALADTTEYYDPNKAGVVTPPAVEHTFKCSDMGNAERMVAQHGQDIRYCSLWGKWLIWDGTRWKIDDTGRVMKLAKKTTRNILAEAVASDDDPARKALVKHALTSENEKRLKAMISLAESELPITPDELDADHWLLNCTNGTVDLRTGQLLPHTRSHYITKTTGIPYHPGTEAPQWGAFLRRVMDGDNDLITFLQRSSGYTATGDVSERIILILYGKGRNGKTTYIETLSKALGDYAKKTPARTFMAKKDEGVPNDLAALKGSRFVLASETEEGRRLAVALVKEATGGDRIAARFMRGEWFDFTPQFKVWLATNHKPIITDSKDGIWDRVKLVPFAVRIPEEEVDKKLPQKLKAELPGILAWVITGCVEWQCYGLDAPKVVTDATKEYRADMDTIQAFINECCKVDLAETVSAKRLYAAYIRWCQDNGEKASSQRALGLNLRDRDGLNKRPGTGGYTYWNGICLNTVWAKIVDDNTTVDLIDEETGINNNDKALVGFPGKQPIKVNRQPQGQLGNNGNGHAKQLFSLAAINGFPVIDLSSGQIGGTMPLWEGYIAAHQDDPEALQEALNLLPTS